MPPKEGIPLSQFPFSCQCEAVWGVEGCSPVCLWQSPWGSLPSRGFCLCGGDGPLRSDGGGQVLACALKRGAVCQEILLSLSGESISCSALPPTSKGVDAPVGWVLVTPAFSSPSMLSGPVRLRLSITFLTMYGYFPFWI